MILPPIFRIWPGYTRSEVSARSVADLPIVDVDAIIADEHTQRAREIACSLSHAKAVREFLKTGAARGVVMEDDAIFTPDRSWVHFTEFDLFIPFAHNRKVVEPDTTIRRGTVPKYGLQAYLITRRFAEAFVPLLEAGGVADHAHHVAARGMKIGSFAGNVVQHDEDASSLISEGRRLHFAKLRKEGKL